MQLKISFVNLPRWATSLSADTKLTAIKDTKLPRAVRASSRVSDSISPPPWETELALLGAFSRLHSSSEEHGMSYLRPGTSMLEL